MRKLDFLVEIYFRHSFDLLRRLKAFHDKKGLISVEWSLNNDWKELLLKGNGGRFVSPRSYDY
jgi:hypothetical protein